MVNLIRKAAGWKAQRLGASWEAEVERECVMKGVAFTEIPDGCRVVGQGRLLRVRSPFDAILHFGGRSVFVDMKRLSLNRFAFSCVDQNQIKSLANASRGGPAGYLCNLNNRIVFIPWPILANMRKGSSVGAEDGIDLGVLGNFNPRLLFPAP